MDAQPNLTEWRYFHSSTTSSGSNYADAQADMKLTQQIKELQAQQKKAQAAALLAQDKPTPVQKVSAPLAPNRGATRKPERRPKEPSSRSMSTSTSVSQSTQQVSSTPQPPRKKCLRTMTLDAAFKLFDFVGTDVCQLCLDTLFPLEPKKRRSRSES